jgi:hypothetical protein
VDPSSVTIIQTRKAGLGLANPMLLHIGNDARVKLRKMNINLVQAKK